MVLAAAVPLLIRIFSVVAAANVPSMLSVICRFSSMGGNSRGDKCFLDSGGHSHLAAEITRAAYRHEDYKQIMGVIARRLQDQDEEWRHVYKSLLLLEYMAKHGPQKVLQDFLQPLVQL